MNLFVVRIGFCLALLAPFVLNAKGLSSPTRDKQSLEQLWEPLVSKGVFARPAEWERTLEQSRRIMVEIGMRAHRALADSIALRAADFVEQGALDKAELCLSVISILDPQSLTLEELKASIALRRSKLAIHKWVAAKGARYMKELGTRSGGVTAIKVLAEGAVVFASVFFLLFAAGQLVKYGLSLLHGLSLAVPGALRATSVLTFTALFWAIFSFVPFGWLHLGFLVAGLLSLYQNAVERYILCAGLLLLALIPAIWPQFTSSSVALRAEAMTLDALNEDPSKVERSQVDGSDREFLATTLAMKRLGDVKEALARLPEGRIRELGAESQGMAHNLRGTLLFAVGRFRAASKEFKESHRLSPKSAAPLFNLSQLAATEGAEAQSKAFLAEASKLQPRLVSKWSQNEGRGLNQLVADIEPTFALFSKDGLGRVAVSFSLPKAGSLGWFVSFGALITLGLCVVLSRSRRRIEVAAACGRCGQSVKVVTEELEERSAVCSACTQVFLLGAHVDRSLRDRREAAVRRFVNLKQGLGWLASLIAPGVRESTEGRHTSLFCYSLAWAVGLCMLGSAWVPIQFDRSWYLPASSDTGYVALALIGCLYLVSLRAGFRDLRRRR